MSCLGAAGVALTDDGTCVVICLAREYEMVRGLVRLQTRMVVEEEPLVIVFHRDSYDSHDKRGGRAITMIPACLFALVAHRSLDKFEYTYATNLGNPLDERATAGARKCDSGLQRPPCQ